MTKLVLVVDDEADIAQTIAEVLELDGYSVRVAGDGQEALGLLADGLRPVLIVMDMTMPRMDAWGFREAERKMDGLSSIPILAMTADGRARGKAQEIGAIGYLRKPMSVDQLLAEVHRVCGASVDA
jgi:CheY-like chemotaxis protein